MDLDIHGSRIVFTEGGWRDARQHLGDASGSVVRRMLKTGKMVKRPKKDGAIGIVKHVSKKGNKTEVVFTVREGELYVISVNTGDEK